MKTLLFVAVICLSTVAANLLLKLGAAEAGRAGGLGALVNWRIGLGLACFAVAAAFYVLVLRWLPLNVAQSFLAAQFIGVVLGAYFILGEPLTLLRLVGITLIATGIAVVAVSQGAS